MIHVGDCLEVMRTLEANSVDAIVTDPPYGLGFMGKAWDHSVPGVPFWLEMLRVAKPGAFLAAFCGTRTDHRMKCAIEDAGWEIRDTIMWVYGSGFPKSHNGPWGGTALKPAWEPITLARKPFKGTVAENFVVHGTAGLSGTTTRCWNIRTSSSESNGGKPHDLPNNRPHRHDQCKRAGVSAGPQKENSVRVNVYAEEMTERVEIIAKRIEGQDFTGLRIYLELPATVGGQQYQGPFMHHPGDDDSSAVTFWGKQDLRVVLRKAIAELDKHYADRRHDRLAELAKAQP